MRFTKFTFIFAGGPISVNAMNITEAKILAQAEAIKRGWNYEIISESQYISKKYRIYYKSNYSRILEPTEEVFDDSFDANHRCFQLNEHSVAGIYGQFTYKEETT